MWLIILFFIIITIIHKTEKNQYVVSAGGCA